MSILSALTYHDRVTFVTFRQVELLHHQPLNSSSGQNMVGGSVTLRILSEATKRFTDSFGSALELDIH